MQKKITILYDYKIVFALLPGITFYFRTAHSPLRRGLGWVQPQAFLKTAEAQKYPNFGINSGLKSWFYENYLNLRKPARRNNY
jgi:hypothetical protein